MIMKPERNAPCPCGSGKKYKKCCYRTNQNLVMNNSTKQQESQTELLDNYESLFSIYNSIHTLFLNKKTHIKEYNKIRKLHGEIVDNMIKYHESGKFKQKIDPNTVTQTMGKKSLHLLESDFNLDTREGSQGFYDIMIYKITANMNCITEEFISNHRYRKPEKIEFLHSMLNAKLGLFEITGIDSYEGYVYLKEIFTGVQYKIVDIGLSGNTNYNNIYIYTRIITYRDISFGTGLNFIFLKNDDFIKKHIQHHRKNYNHNGEFLRFTQLYNQFSKYPDEIRIVTNEQK